MQLFLKANTQETFLIQLIVDYLKLEQKNKVQVVTLSKGALTAIADGKLKLTAPTLVTSTGQVLESLTKISYELISASQWGDFFFGETPELRQQISKVETHIKPEKEQLKYLQKHLESRTFFAGNHLTFADIFVFTKIHNLVAEFTNENKTSYCNIFRWFKNVQNQSGIKQYLVKAGKAIVVDQKAEASFIEKKKK